MNLINTIGSKLAKDFVKFLDYTLFVGNLSQLPVDEHLVINTLNPHSVCEAEKDSLFKEALQNSSILLPDGIGVVLAHNFFNKQKIRKISGMDLFNALIARIHLSPDQNHKRVFFLGSTNNTLGLIQARFSQEYPDIKIECYSPPFKSEFSEQDNLEMFKHIKAFNPHILFVGMTAPKQEKWAFKNRAFLDTKIICSVGAVFDFYAGTVVRPAKIWIDLGLEWLVRFVHEPKRLWKRNLISTPKFIFMVIKHKLNL